ncbi:MAG TPA: UrcA family protein [Sphingomicrobium sp.]
MLKTFPALAALAAASALLVPTVSQAEDQNSVRVSYADLDLAKSIGQQRLQHRIAFAAERVCGFADARDLNYTRAVGDCRTETVADAQPAFQAAVARALRPSVTVLEAATIVVTAH